jgi:hypothetical protein
MSLMLAGLAWVAGCSRGPAAKPMDEPMRLAAEAGSSEWAAGRYDAAAADYERALARAYLRGELRSAAAFRYRIASCRAGQGLADEARQGFAAAALEAQAAGAPELAARSEAAGARMALKEAGAEEARALALKALGRNTPAAGGKTLLEPRLLADLHLVLAEVAALQGGDQVTVARREWQTAREIADKENGDPVLEAMLSRAQGTILSAEPAQWEKAVDAFHQESLSWRKAGRYEESAAAMEMSFHVLWTRVDRPDQAAERALDAARLRFGLGDRKRAGELADLAINLSLPGLQKPGRPDIAEQARILKKVAP